MKIEAQTMNYVDPNQPDHFLQLEIIDNGVYAYREYTYLGYTEQDGTYVELYRYNQAEPKIAHYPEMLEIVQGWKFVGTQNLSICANCTKMKKALENDENL